MPSNYQRRQERELREARRAGYEEGARATLLQLYLSVAADFGLDGVQWISGRMSGTPKLDATTIAEVEKRVTLDVIADIKKYNPKRAAMIEKSFADFLAGDSK